MLQIFHKNSVDLSEKTLVKNELLKKCRSIKYFHCMNTIFYLTIINAIVNQAKFLSDLHHIYFLLAQI